MSTLRTGVLALAIACTGVLVLEWLSPGFTWLTLQVLARMSWLAAQAVVWPLAFGGAALLGWTLGKNRRLGKEEDDDVWM